MYTSDVDFYPRFEKYKIPILDPLNLLKLWITFNVIIL